ncbi:D-3-phosphoglycerate dehydrogenase [Planktothrix tepida]|uniref:Phosphoglycerate dehydrogenase n=1 Tax=Planktothrix tepida PCC 9214 TaxID=671072 RepID=A0A1J1LSL1_9CYAN|nr:NAD(P)-dependent oxidoreductase [Planktothrix tepida]CAD5990002.1 D-3-phosphoglycerate dehydrogenase [Planktothrix tepida]CUR35592.1 Phosphoglycerate dehydrogenase [Planktothrix tepida PCC 9214]
MIISNKENSVVCVDRLNILPQHKLVLQSCANTVFYEDLPNDSQIVDRVACATIAIVNRVKVSKVFLENAVNLKYLITSNVGYDNVNLELASSYKVKVINCPTYCSDATAEHTIGLLFSIIRKIVEANLDIRNGYWRKNLYTGMELKGRTICLIGKGNVGTRVGKIALSLGLNVSYVTKETPFSEIESLVSNADVISLHIPLNYKTHHFFNAKLISLMKKKAYLINTSRGGIIDQDFLFEALKSNLIAGAALDVFAEEPIDNKTNYSINELACLDNVVVTPHIGFRTEESLWKLGEELLKNVKSCLEGNAINVVQI